MSICAWEKQDILLKHKRAGDRWFSLFTCQHDGRGPYPLIYGSYTCEMLRFAYAAWQYIFTKVLQKLPWHSPSPPTMSSCNTSILNVHNQWVLRYCVYAPYIQTLGGTTTMTTFPIMITSCLPHAPTWCRRLCCLVQRGAGRPHHVTDSNSRQEWQSSWMWLTPNSSIWLTKSKIGGAPTPFSLAFLQIC